DGSSRGIADARRGTAEIGMASRALNAEESDLQAHAIARDGICMIVHADNPATGLSRAHVRETYSGAIAGWSDIGGDALPITVVHKADGRSTQELFLKHYELAAPEVNADVIIGDNEQGIKTVAGSAGCIGYVSIGAAEFAAGDGSPIRLLPVGGVTPSTENVANRSFPLSRDLSFVTAGKISPLAQDFIDFAQSAAVRDLIEAQFFVPMN
ncbi:MAG: phosphate transport system substrate-binding protein, partial [Rhodothermales bacterium]